MNINLATTDDIEKAKAEIIEEMKKLLGGDRSDATRKWLKSPEVRRMLKVSPGTLQNMRVNGTLPFTKIGAVIYYDYADIVKMLEAGKHNALRVPS